MRIAQLHNGIKIVYDNLDLFGTVSFGIFLGKGSKHEKDYEHGITHFIEHMLFKSNISFLKSSSIDNIEKRGALVNGFTTKEFICVHTKALKSEIKPIINLLFDMFFSPLFLNDEINIEKKVMLPRYLVFSLKFHKAVYTG